MNRGTTVLAPFPFTDLSGRKTRPAVVVSPTGWPGSDVILAFVTSHRGQPLFPADLLVDSTHGDFVQTGLKMSSVIKFDKLVTIDRSVILGELGELSPGLLALADDRLRQALGL
jgi:mRNA interferase MazF